MSAVVQAPLGIAIGQLVLPPAPPAPTPPTPPVPARPPEPEASGAAPSACPSGRPPSAPLALEVHPATGPRRGTANNASPNPMTVAQDPALRLIKTLMVV